MKYKVTGLSLCILFAISACNSKSTESQQSETGSSDGVDNLLRISSLSESIDSFEGVNNIGWFEIDESDQLQLVDSNAVFFEIDSDNPQSNRATIFLDTPGDTCAVEYRDSMRETLFNDIKENGVTVSVGEVITMFEVGAPYKYSELAHLGLATEGSYINYLDLPYPSPDLLNISATGEAFSAFSLTVEKPSPLVGLSIANGRLINSGATISWSASEDTDTMLNIRLEESTGNVASFVVDCMVIDDGQFTLPTNTNLGVDANARTILQVANRLRVGSVRVGTDQVVMMRIASRYR